MAICCVFEKIAMISVPFVCSLLQDISYYLPFVLMFVLAVLGCIVVAPLRETNGRPTREKFEDFFNDHRVDANTVTPAEIGLDNVATE